MLYACDVTYYLFTSNGHFIPTIAGRICICGIRNLSYRCSGEICMEYTLGVPII